MRATNVRLFIAIELDEAGRTAVAAELDRLQAAIDRSRASAMRWVKPSHMHLTLVFLGDVHEDRVAALSGAVSHPLPLDSFVIGFGGCGVFPSGGAPRVLWLGLTCGASEVGVVRHAVLRRLPSGGAVTDHFEPHLTLARWRTSRPADRRAVTALRCNGEVFRLLVDHVSLIRSELTSTGPAYSILAEARLEGQRRPTLQSGP
jgi:2'-5' RNA ligase